MIKVDKSAGKSSIKSQYYSSSSIQYEWIEKLLQTPIEDGRKYTLGKYCVHIWLMLKNYNMKNHIKY